MFQSTHPHGVRPDKNVAEGIKAQFQSTHPHGVRLQFVVYYIVICIVSIHAPTRGATPEYKLGEVLALVSIHAPTRGATCSCTLTTALCCCFNPRTHTGCDTINGRPATFRLFQSTHPHGVRLHQHYAFYTYYRFNPRTHTGCDIIGIVRQCNLQVSIHAPTRGATGCSSRRWCAWASFNPRTHTGCDDFPPNVITPARLFQSTHPHGVRRCTRRVNKSSSGFNPRTHTGCDSDIQQYISRLRVSIHAPTRGATSRTPFRQDIQ